ncbi:hypothetical protein BDI4_300061 [Burkholderia diffusa]|nr:hypothetical protein BDI4_300061 [Burkholderia diffusa]
MSLAADHHRSSSPIQCSGTPKNGCSAASADNERDFGMAFDECTALAIEQRAGADKVDSVAGRPNVNGT